MQVLALRLRSRRVASWERQGQEQDQVVSSTMASRYAKQGWYVSQHGGEGCLGRVEGRAEAHCQDVVPLVVRQAGHRGDKLAADVIAKDICRLGGEVGLDRQHNDPYTSPSWLS